jgi:hypothetical protein
MLVCASLLFAHETAGAARTRHSLRPLLREVQKPFQTSGGSCREIAESHSDGNHVIAGAAKKSIATLYAEGWIASAFARRATAEKSRSLSSAPRTRDPLARNDESQFGTIRNKPLLQVTGDCA